MKTISDTEIKELLSVKFKGWTFDGRFLHRDLKFKSFVDAFSFMTAVAFEAEKMNHHPDWSNVYNNVIINLNTHEANGITQMDIDLAGKIDNISRHYN